MPTPAPSSASVVDSPYSWFRLAVSVLLATVGGSGIWAIVVVIPAIQEDFGVTRAGAALAYTCTMTGFAVGNLVVGRFVDKLGISTPAVFTAIALGVGFIAAAGTNEIWQLALIQGLYIGMGTATTFGPIVADISHWFKKRRAFAIAAAASGNYFAGAIWPPVMKGFIETEGWRATYVGIGVVVLVTMIPLALMLKRQHPDRQRGAAPPPDDHLGMAATMISAKNLQLMLIIAGVACCVAMSMPQVHIVAYSDDLGYGVARGAEMLGLMLAGGVISRLFFGFVGDYLGGIRTCLLASSLQCMSLLLFLPFDSVVALYTVSFVFGLSQGGIVPSYAVIIREYLPAREAASRVGMVMMATIIGMALGGFLSGWIFDYTSSYQLAFINGIAWNLLNVSILVMLLWRLRSAKPLTA